MRALPAILIGAVASACGGTETTNPPVTNSCGTVEQAPAEMGCTGLASCGGMSNAIKVTFCKYCFARPDTKVCEAGTCRAIDISGSISTQLQVPEVARGAKSFTIASVNPIMADGTKVTCATLLSTCAYADNFAINTGNSTFRNFNPPADPANVYPAPIAADAGAGRLLVVRLTSEVQGAGNVMAVGCTEGIDVVSGQTANVDLTLKAP